MSNGNTNAFSPARDRIMSRVSINENGCWNWKLRVDRDGYGSIDVDGKRTRAHRAAYEAFRAPIPANLVLDHLCRNPRCCNPDHLEVVTRRVNTLRGTGPSARNAKVTHCPAGHEYNSANTYIGPRGERNCRACNRTAVARLKAKS